MAMKCPFILILCIGFVGCEEEGEKETREKMKEKERRGDRNAYFRY